MKNRINIICILWVGEFRGRNFGPGDVARLKESVSKHIDREYDFYCLTNCSGAVPAKKLRLKHPEWPGWWAKVELHRPDLPVQGRTLYMDLDSHAVRSLQPILDYPGDLVMFPTPIPEEKWSHLRKMKWVPRYQAATMLFDPGCAPMQLVWRRFIKNPTGWMARYRSEQDVMGAWIPDQPMFPRKWMLKLETVRKLNRVNDETIIVTGQPPDGLFKDIKQKLPWLEEMARA